jgi:hypothetical protein
MQLVRVGYAVLRERHKAYWTAYGSAHQARQYPSFPVLVASVVLLPAYQPQSHQTQSLLATRVQRTDHDILEMTS